MITIIVKLNSLIIVSLYNRLFKIQDSQDFLKNLEFLI